MAQAREHQMASVTSTTIPSSRVAVPCLETVNVCTNATSILPQASFVSRELKAVDAGGQKYITEVIEKLDWSVHELKHSHNVEQSIQLCHLIRSCAEAVTSLKTAFES